MKLIKHILFIISCLIAGCNAAFAQTPVSPIQLTTNTAYLEPSTGFHWYYNGATYAWWTALGLRDSTHYITPYYFSQHSTPLGTALLKANNLSDVANAATSLANIGGVSLTGSYANPSWITSLAWSKITGTPTSLSGYGIIPQSSDYSAFYPLLSGNYINPSWIVSIPFSKITATPTTLSGYGITDAYTKTQSDAMYQLLSNLSTSTLLGTSNTLYPSQNAVKAYVDGQITGHAYTNGYGLNLNSFVFSADSTNLVNKTFFNSVVGTATLARINGYVPTSRILSINGTTLDLSTNRSWSVGTVTNVSSSTTDINVAIGSTTPVLTLNNVNGITKNYYDPTSSIQTQLDGKLPLTLSQSTIVNLNNYNLSFNNINDTLSFNGTGISLFNTSGVGIRTNKFIDSSLYSWSGPVTNVFSVKGITHDDTAFSLITYDDLGNPVASFDNTGRMNLIDYSGNGAVAVLYNKAPPAINTLTGHLAWGARNGSGNMNTTAAIASVVIDTTTTSMSSQLVLKYMDNMDTSPGYSQPNKQIVIDKNGFDLGGLPITEPNIVNPSLIGAVNMAANGSDTFPASSYYYIANIAGTQASAIQLSSAGNTLDFWGYNGTAFQHNLSIGASGFIGIGGYRYDPTSGNVLGVNGTAIGAAWKTIGGTALQLVDGTGALQTIPTGLPPTGSAGGDLTGTYPNPTTNTINGITKNYYDPTSSIQTQLDGKQAAGSYLPLTANVAFPVTNLIYLNTGINNTPSVGGSNANYNILGSSGVWGIRTGVGGDMNIDTYNAGTSISALQILQNGNVNIAGNLSTSLPAYTSGTNLPVVYNSTNNRFETNSSILTNPMTTPGDIIYGGTSGTPTRFAGNTTTATKFLTSTGNGSTSGAPAYYDLFNNANNWVVQTFNQGMIVSSGAQESFVGSSTGATAINGALNSGATNYTQQLQAANGTIALTSDISSYPLIKYQHQIFTPTTGSTVSLTNGYYNIIKPASSLASLIISMPNSPSNNDAVYMTVQGTVASITYINGTVNAPTSSSAGNSLTIYVYDSGTNTWY